MSTWLCESAKAGDEIEFLGPMGSFYLRPIERPVLFLAGGTGLAPFLSMLDKIVEDGGSPYPIHMILGVNTDEDLVGTDRLEAYAERMPNFTYACTVASPESAHPTGAMSRITSFHPSSTTAMRMSISVARRPWLMRCAITSRSRG